MPSEDFPAEVLEERKLERWVTEVQGFHQENNRVSSKKGRNAGALM